MGRLLVALVRELVGTFASFVLGIFNPHVTNKAGPDWMWGGGRDDVIRNLYFKPNGDFPPLRPRGAPRHALRSARPRSTGCSFSA